MASILITGASRGFGFALVCELYSRPETEISKTFATARGDPSPLSEVATASSGRVSVVKLDVTDELFIRNAAAEVEKQFSSKGLDILINTAGVCQYVDDGVKSMDNLAESFTVNALGVHYVTRAFLPLLQRDCLKKLGYCSFKSMKTDLGGGDIADLTSEQGAKASFEILFRPNAEINGQFLKVFIPGWENATGQNVYDETIVPW